MATITTEEFNQVYKEYYRRLCGVVYKILKDHERTNDVVQNVFLKLFKQNYDELRSNPFPWLCVVCRNDSLKVIRKEKRYQELSDFHLDQFIDETNGLDNTVFAERVRELKKAMESLTKKQKDVIMTRFYADLSYKECAKKLKITKGNVGFIQNAAIAKLRSLLTA